MTLQMKEPAPATSVLHALDNGAQMAMKQAGRDLRPVVAGEVPRGRTGATQAALKPRTARTGTGQSLTVGPGRGKRHPSGATISQVVRWVTKGTGVRRKGGGAKRRIHSPRLYPYGRRMVLPGGARRFYVKGQSPNPFMDRIMAQGDRKVQAALRQGAQHASDEAARLVAR